MSGAKRPTIVPEAMDTPALRDLLDGYGVPVVGDRDALTRRTQAVLPVISEFSPRPGLVFVGSPGAAPGAGEGAAETLALLLRKTPSLRLRALLLQPLDARALRDFCRRAGLELSEAALRAACAQLNVAIA
jgi:hypothetical protein